MNADTTVKPQDPDTVIIGIGNLYRSDDGIGILVARELQKRGIPNVSIIEKNSKCETLMDAWAGKKRVIVVDAASSGSNPGTVHRFNAGERPLPANTFRHSTHAFSIAEAIEIGRILGSLPSELLVYGIEGENFAPGTDISPNVATLVPGLVKSIQEDIISDHRTPG